MAEVQLHGVNKFYGSSQALHDETLPGLPDTDKCMFIRNRGQLTPK